MNKFITMKRINFIALTIASFAFFASLLAQFGFDKQPCKLCLISRALYALIAISAGVVLKINRSAWRKVLIGIIAASVGFSFYHLGVENHWWAAPKGCSYEIPNLDEIKDIKKQFSKKQAVRCDQVNWEIFGVSSTLWNFGIMAGLFWLTSLGYAVISSRDKAEDENS